MSYVRAFKLSNFDPGIAAGPGQIFELKMDDYYNQDDLARCKLFICNEWKDGYGGHVPSYIFYNTSTRKWNMYCKLPGSPHIIHTIVVPDGMSKEDCYSTAIFTHTANADNTMIPCGDKITHAEDKYLTYIDNRDINGKPNLKLIVTRVIDVSSSGDHIIGNTHHYAVWYDSLINQWAIVYPSRYPILPGTKFNVMAMENEADEWNEPEIRESRKFAFAFEHDIHTTGGAISTNINTTSLDKNQSEKLLRSADSPTDITGINLIVVVTEYWKGQFLNGLPRENNTFPLSVWYIPTGYVWHDNEVPPSHTDRWAVFTNLNGPIDPDIKINVCTRLPCPIYCNG